MTKMIITDLDNTLLRNDKTISHYTASVLNKCRQNNIKIVFATARPARVAQHDIFTPDAIIADNGAIIDYGGKVIHKTFIQNKTLNLFIKELIASENVTCLTVETGEKLFISKEQQLWAADDNRWNLIYNDFSADISEQATKLAIEYKDISMLRTLMKNYPELHLYENTGSNWCQAMHVSSTKNNAVKILADYYNYNLNEILAFGDDYNDVEMLKQCGTGVAVSNAIEEAKAVADYICGSNDNDGVAKWLEEHIL